MNAPVECTGATDSDAHEAAVVMIRTWLDRHPRPIYGDDTWWPDWAARNFLADPEVRAHVTLVAEQRTAEERLAAVLAVLAVLDEPIWEHAPRPASILAHQIRRAAGAS